MISLKHEVSYLLSKEIFGLINLYKKHVLSLQF
jgi:hypothetical protein